MGLVISFVGVLLFAGLTAYDTQRTKSMYYEVRGTSMQDRVVIMSALSLYLDFINMFMFILRLTGSSRD
jgi:FtsH-binding integral membrane protein